MAASSEVTNERRYFPWVFDFAQLFAVVRDYRNAHLAPEADRTTKTQEAAARVKTRGGFPGNAKILISGEAGTGKTTFALALVRALMIEWSPCEDLKKISKSDKEESSWSPEGQTRDRVQHYLYFLSTEVSRQRLQNIFGQYGWFTEGEENSSRGDRIFTPGTVRVPHVPVGSMRLPAQGPHELVDLVLAQLKADITDAPQKPTFVIVDSLTAILKDSRNVGERRRETLEFMNRIQQTLGPTRQAPMFLISERGPQADSVAYAEDIAADFVFHLGRKPTSPGRALRTLTISKSAGVDMSPGEHSWALIANESGLDRVIAEQNSVRQLVMDRANPPGAYKGAKSGPWATICVFPRPLLMPIGKRNDRSKKAADQSKPEPISTGTPGLDEMLNSENKPDYWASSALNAIPPEPGKSILEGTTTLLVGTAGTGKTTACLQFLNNESVKEHTLYINFEHPVSRVRQFYNPTSPFENLFNSWQSIFRRRGNLDINALLAEVRHVIRDQKVRRIAIDGLSDLLATTQKADYARLVEMLLGTISEAGGGEVTNFVTFELEGEQQGTGNLAIEGLSAAADNVVVFRQLAINDELRKTVHVLKARGMNPDRQVRELITTKHETFPLQIVDTLESYGNLLSGSPKPVEIALQLFAENDAERAYNKDLATQLEKMFSYPIHMFGFSRSSLNRTLEDLTSRTSRVPPTDIKVFSLDEWWTREFGEFRRDHPLLPLDPFFARRDGTDNDAAGQSQTPSQQQFWFFEIEKASVCEFEKKAQPETNNKALEKPGEATNDERKVKDAYLLGLPSYTDFGLFCLNRDVAMKCADYYQNKAADPACTSELKPTYEWRKTIMRELANETWPRVLDCIPRTWVKKGPNNPWGFAKPNPDRPGKAERPFYLVDLLEIARLAGFRGFSFDAETTETVCCTFLEFCWNFGSTEGFLHPRQHGTKENLSEDRVAMVSAVNFLQYLVHHGFMSSTPTLRDAEESLFSRQWYSTLPEINRFKISGLGLTVLPFFPLGAISSPKKALLNAFNDECDRLRRLAERIKATVKYRQGDGSPFKALPGRPIVRAGRTTAPTLEDLNKLERWCKELRKKALAAKELGRGYRVTRKEADEHFQGDKKDLPVARSLNIRDVLELLTWHQFRVDLMRAELEGGSLTSVLLNERDKELPASASGKQKPSGVTGGGPAALVGYCCSGSWMLGAGRKTHSPHLSWKLMEEMTSLDQSIDRANAGAGIPVRKDFYDGHGHTKVRHIEHLTWNQLLRYGDSRCRRRDRVVEPSMPFKSMFRKLNSALINCLTIASAAKDLSDPGMIDAAKEHANTAIDELVDESMRRTSRAREQAKAPAHAQPSPPVAGPSADTQTPSGGRT